MIKAKLIKFSLYTIVLSIIFNSQLHAAYVGNPARIFTPDEKEFSLYTEGVADITYDRKSKHQADDTEVDFYGAIAGIVYKNTVSIYGGVGAAKVKETYVVNGSKVKWQSDWGFTWLTGGAVKIYEKRLNQPSNMRLITSLDIQYRNTDLDPDTVFMDSSEFDIPDPEITYSTMEYNDWHVALTCGLDMERFCPYVGIKYSDFESCVRARRGALMYEKNNAEADDNFGIILGAGVKLAGQLYANIEASLIDENSISGAFSWKF
jgi:hypothetical protein